MKSTKRILIVDDEENLCFTLKHFLAGEGYQVDVAYNYENALQALSGRNYDLALLDILLDTRPGTDLLKYIRENTPDCPVVMITGVPTIETASEAVRLGAFDYLPKPVLKPQLLEVTRRALDTGEAIKKKEKRAKGLSATIEHVQDGIITVDMDCTILVMNERAGQLCGYNHTRAIARNLAEVLQELPTQNAELLASIMQGDKKGGTISLSGKGASEGRRKILLDCQPLLDERDRSIGALLTVRADEKQETQTVRVGKRSGMHRIIGASDEMQRIYSMVDCLCDLTTTVLITGETGTGKELLAEAIHHCGKRHSKPLVRVNCATISDTLLESELFGHVKGAFSSAIRDNRGRFEMADGGTIFLDEIGEISPRMQLALLRVLQEKEFERVGDTTPIKVDVRVIAATNRDLAAEVEKGNFRQDLYYRLRVVPLHLPPLRKRQDDIPLLAASFIEEFNEEFSKSIKGVLPEVHKIFNTYTWPGNIRELKNVIEHAFILCHEERIGREHLSPEIVASGPQAGEKGRGGDEREVILSTLEQCRWNKSQAARKLGMSRQHLYRKLKDLGIDE